MANFSTFILNMGQVTGVQSDEIWHIPKSSSAR